MLLRTPRSKPFPYTTLFRSIVDVIEIKEGVAPSPARLAKLAATIREQKIRVIVHEPFEPEEASQLLARRTGADRKSTRLNSSHLGISYAVFCLKKKISKANRTDAVRDATSIFAKNLNKCPATVFSLMNSASAISRVVLPSARNASTSACLSITS